MSKMFQWRDREIDFFLYIETDKQPPGVISFFLFSGGNQSVAVHFFIRWWLWGGGRRLGFYHTFIHYTHTTYSRVLRWL